MSTDTVTDRICLDFDGVLHSYESWKGADVFDPPVPGAQLFVSQLIELGYEVIVQSTRAETTEGWDAMVAWPAKHDFSPIAVTHVKPKAVLYVDNRGYRFEGNFGEVLAFIGDHPTLEPWNRG